LVRVFREEWRRRGAHYQSGAGGGLPLDQAVERATHDLSEEEGAELFRRLMTRSAEAIDFDDLHRMGRSVVESERENSKEREDKLQGK
jgi:hypothetical protein